MKRKYAAISAITVLVLAGCAKHTDDKSTAKTSSAPQASSSSAPSHSSAPKNTEGGQPSKANLFNKQHAKSHLTAVSSLATSLQSPDAGIKVFGLSLGMTQAQADAIIDSKAKSGEAGCSLSSANYSLTNTIAQQSYSCRSKTQDYHLFLKYAAGTSGLYQIHFADYPNYNILYPALKAALVKRYGNPTSDTGWRSAEVSNFINNYSMAWLFQGGKLLQKKQISTAEQSCITPGMGGGFSNELYGKILPCHTILRGEVNLNQNGTIYEYSLTLRSDGGFSNSQKFLTHTAIQKAEARKQKIAEESAKAAPTL